MAAAIVECRGFARARAIPHLAVVGSFAAVPAAVCPEVRVPVGATSHALVTLVDIGVAVAFTSAVVVGVTVAHTGAVLHRVAVTFTSAVNDALAFLCK